MRKLNLKGFNLKTKLRNFFRKINFFSKIEIKSEVKESLREILFYAIVPGSLINYSLWGVFGIPFDYYTFPAYGIFLYLIKYEFTNIWARLWFRIVD